MFLKISQISRENTCEISEILKNSFFYRATPVAASETIRKGKKTIENKKHQKAISSKNNLLKNDTFSALLTM